jgi:hypothetical protein
MARVASSEKVWSAPGMVEFYFMRGLGGDAFAFLEGDYVVFGAVDE